MKHLFAIVFALTLAGCVSTYHWPGDDGVPYASYGRAYTYVDGYYGFPYYGPYSRAWYNPIWYSPLSGSHYVWYRPYSYWAGPYGLPVGNVAYRGGSQKNKGKSNGGGSPSPVYRPILPVDLDQVTIESRASRSGQKYPAHRSPEMKQRLTAKGSQSYKSSRTASSGAYRASSSRPAPRSSTTLPSSTRRVSESEY